MREVAAHEKSSSFDEWPIDLLAVACVAVVVAVNLLLLWEPAFISNDATQYIDVARGLARGDGAVTRIAFYEKQHAIGSFPIPQAVFPPGYPLAIAAGVLVGLSATGAAFAIGVVSHVAIGLLLWATLRICCASRVVPVVTATAWLLLAEAQANVLALLSDVPFTAATVLGAFLVAAWIRDGGNARLGLIWCGLLAGVAFSIRYPGLFYIAALALVFGWRWLLVRERRELWDAASVLVPAGLVVGAVLLRNMLVAGEMVANPAVSLDPQLADVARSFYRAVGILAGLSWSEALGGEMPDALVPIGLGAGLAILLLAPGSGREGQAGSHASRTLQALAAGYSIVTIAALLYLASVRSADLITSRYLLPLVPFMLAAVAIAIDRSVQRRSVGRLRGAAVVAFVLVAVLLGQRNILAEKLRQGSAYRTYAVLEQALIGTPASVAALEALHDETGQASPKLTSESQIGSLFLEDPLVGIPEERFSTRPWTEARVRSLVSTFGVSHVLAFPGLGSEPDSQEGAPIEVFLTGLAGGQMPAWLELEFSSDVLRIYRVTAPME